MSSDFVTTSTEKVGLRGCPRGTLATRSTSRLVNVPLEQVGWQLFVVSTPVPTALVVSHVVQRACPTITLPSVQLSTMVTGATLRSPSQLAMATWWSAGDLPLPVRPLVPFPPHAAAPRATKDKQQASKRPLDFDFSGRFAATASFSHVTGGVFSRSLAIRRTA